MYSNVPQFNISENEIMNVASVTIIISFSEKLNR